MLKSFWNIKTPCTCSLSIICAHCEKNAVLYGSECHSSLVDAPRPGGTVKRIKNEHGARWLSNMQFVCSRLSVYSLVCMTLFLSMGSVVLVSALPVDRGPGALKIITQHVALEPVSVNTTPLSTTGSQVWKTLSEAMHGNGSPELRQHAESLRELHMNRYPSHRGPSQGSSLATPSPTPSSVDRLEQHPLSPFDFQSPIYIQPHRILVPYHMPPPPKKSLFSLCFHPALLRMVKMGKVDDLDRMLFVAKMGNPEVFDYYINAPDPFDWFGRTALMLAVANRDLETIDKLLEYGADINAREADWGDSAIVHAALEQDAHLMRHLIRKGAKVTFRFLMRMDLHFAAAALLDVVGNDDYRDQEGNTPLMLAVEYDALTSLVMMASKRRPRVHLQNNAGQNIFHLMALYGQEGMMHLINDMIKKFVQPRLINQKDENGMTPLMLAAELGHTGIVDILIQWKANIHLRNDKLFLGPSVLEGERDADIQLVNSKGETALFYAIAGKCLLCVEALLKAGADVNDKLYLSNLPFLYWNNASRIEQDCPEGVDCLPEETFETGEATADTIEETADTLEPPADTLEPPVDTLEASPIPYTPLLSACILGHIPTVKTLLDHGATLDFNLISMFAQPFNSSLHTSHNASPDAYIQIHTLLLEHQEAQVKTGFAAAAAA